MSKIVVTGGAGFIGSHVTKLLCDRGYEVIVIDNLTFGLERLVDKRAKFVHGSISNSRLLDEVLPNAKVVIHLAASSIIKFSYEFPFEYVRNNILYPTVLLEAMRRNNVKQMIFSSSAAVYGEPKKQPINENDATHPITVYGATKLAFEKILEGYYQSFGIHSTCLRYFNAYGPNDWQEPATRAVPVWIRNILEDRPIPLYWKGEQARDYVYAEDIARAHLAVLDLKGFNIYNIGSGKTVLVKNILTMLTKISGKKPYILDKGIRQGDPKMLLADISKIQKEIGWTPIISLEEGLQRTYNYYYENIGLHS